MPTMLILGATSDIARACALAFAHDGWDLILAGRNNVALEKSAADIAIRSERKVSFAHFDALYPETHALFWDTHAANVDGILCAVGYLGDQDTARHDVDSARQILETNFTNLVPLLSRAADSFEERSRGLIIGIGSVAGDRGRASNYIYGSAKAGFAAFLSGLRNRLSRKGVRVITVKPGFVATKMTKDMELPGLLTASPEQVASDIVRAFKKGTDTVYSRWFWKWIMCCITHIPERIFKKTSL